MRAHRNDVYRARRSRGKVWPVLLWILAGLIVLAVILFYAGQKYIVYGSDGSLHVVFPIMETPAPVTDDGQPETVDTELVLEDPDYSGIVSDAGAGLSELHAQYLTADKITPEGLTRAAASVKAAGGNALVLQMKSPGGTLSWKSGVSEASAYGVNGTAELADALRTVKGQNIYLVAVVSTCVDSLMAERYAATALQTASGSAYTDGSGGWVDPYNTFTRTYLVSLCKELRELGFDEVAFSYLQQPLAAAELKYADQTGSPFAHGRGRRAGKVSAREPDRYGPARERDRERGLHPAKAGGALRAGHDGAAEAAGPRVRVRHGGQRCFAPERHRRRQQL